VTAHTTAAVNIATIAENKQRITDGRAHPHAALQFPCTMTWLFMYLVKRDPHTCCLLLWPVVYYKCIAQIVEMVIDFLKSKTRTIKIFEK